MEKESPEGFNETPPNEAKSKPRAKKPARRSEPEELAPVVADAAPVVEQPAQVREPKVAPGPVSGKLAINMSGSLFQKLQSQAIDEGLTINDYVAELLSESVTMRAWEIMERKAQMRGSNHANGNNNSRPNNNNNNNNNGGLRRDRNGRRGMNHARYQNIMDDKASFMEYVRNQERKR